WRGWPVAESAELSESARYAAILTQELRIGDAGVAEAVRAEHAAVAVPAGPAVGQRIVAARRQTVLQPERDPLTDDLGLAHRDERRVHVEPAALDAGAGRHGGETL